MIFLVLSFSYSLITTNRLINVTTYANWMETPLILEALSFIQDIDHGSYWDLIYILSNMHKIPSSISEILDLFKDFLNDDSLQLLEFSLKIRYYSPRVDFIRKTLTGKKENLPYIMCGSEMLENSNYYNCNTKFFDFEPVFGNGNSSIALYIDINRNNWKQKLIDLQNLENKVKFVIRWVGFSNERIKISGYGIQLKPFKYAMDFNLKDTQNKIKPDSKYNNITNEIENFPLTPDFSGKKDHINIDYLKYQISMVLRNSSDPINALQQLLSNYPLFKNKISKISVNESIINHYLEKPKYSSSGNSDIFVNGRKLSCKNLDLFNLYKTLMEEYLIDKTFKELLKLDEDLINDFKKINSSVKPSQTFLDSRSDYFLYWINDLEKDEEYINSYSRSMKVFFKQNKSWPKIAKNLANAIFIVDPSDQDDLDTIWRIDKMAKELAPIRLGYIISPNKRSQLAKKVYYAYAHLALKYGMNIAHKMLIKVNEMRISDKNYKEGLSVLKQNYWSKVFDSIAIDRKSPSFKTITELFNKDSDETIFIEKVNEHIKMIGVKTPSMIFNGKVIESVKPEKYIYSQLQEEENIIRELLSRKIIKDDTKDIHDIILKQKNAFRRFNRLIQTQDNSFSRTVNIQEESFQIQRNFIKWVQSIKYQYGSNLDVKFQTLWIFLNCKFDVIEEIDKFIVDISNLDHIRIKIFKKEEKIPDFIQRIINIPEGKVTIVFNGRIVSFDPNNFYSYDLKLIQEFENQYSTMFADNLYKKSLKRRSLGNSRSIRNITDSIFYMSLIHSSLSHEGISRYNLNPKLFKKHAVNLFHSKNNCTSLSIFLYLDPFSIEGQRLTSVLKYLKLFNLWLLLNPKLSKPDTDILNTFYRISFDNNVVLPFFNESTMYSIIPDVPRNWNVISIDNNFDIYNLIINNLFPGSFNLTFELSSVLIEGYSKDKYGISNKELELWLYKKHVEDRTLIMQMNGYWQLKSHSPGQYYISTNSNQIFEINQDSFLPKFNFIESNEDVIYNNHSFNEDDKIHIFVVSSGFFYERLQRIMMLSVIKHTKSLVKFWIFENFVSSQHRNLLNIISKKYNFEYEFISYKWPKWLPIETTQQRLVWGYKILFLDVIFPKNLKRVIYIDSDDVVRSDLSELMNLNLNSAPYAFTPFCEDKSEMKEYRFWNDGYWKDILQDKKYHISALFVVDLIEYRKQGVGDKIRKAYSDLFNDHHSLSNLDQDLPNLLQSYGVNIYSLPQEWLWCGSWCSDKSMKNAKIIDMCNNPKTKMNKLSYAQEKISEWKELDDEINSIETIDEL